MNNTTEMTASAIEFTTEAAAAAAGGEEAWLVNFKKFQLAVVVVGLALNIVGLLVFFLKASKSLNVMTLMLLKHQSTIDTTICLLNVLYLIPEMPDSSGNVFLCYLWYSQTFYWILVVLGVWNLLLICIERFMAVVLPIRYKSKKPIHVILMIVGIQIWAIILAAPVTFYVRHQNGICMFGTLTFDSPALIKFLEVHTAIWFLGIYMIPMIGMVVMYAKIIWVIRAASGATSSSDSKQSSAASDFTKTAIVVTSIFVFSFSFDSFYYVVSTFHPLVDYVVNAPLRKVQGVFCCCHCY